MFSDDNECEAPEGSPCQNNGTCINTQGSYQCDCVEGWQNHDCQDGKCLSTLNINDYTSKKITINDDIILQLTFRC
jgi:hypothetical protein